MNVSRTPISEFTHSPISTRAQPMAPGDFLLKVEPEGHCGTVEQLLEWLNGNRQLLKAGLLRHGAILFRGFSQVADIGCFEQVVDTVCPHLMSYVGGTTSRQPLSGKINTASGALFKGVIPVHQEMSYQQTFPTHLMFFCQQPAGSGGETLLASAREFRRHLPDEIWQMFAARELVTSRTLSPRDARWSTWKGRTWPDALLTDSRGEAERIMNSQGWNFRWTPAGGLNIKQAALPAVRQHPQTGEAVWFNQCHINNPFMVRSSHWAGRRYVRWLGSRISHLLTRGRSYPTQTRFADGSAIPVRYLRRVQRALDTSTVALKWQKSDFLIMDNYLTLHGRARFRGERCIGAALLTSAFEQSVAAAGAGAQEPSVMPCERARAG